MNKHEACHETLYAILNDVSQLVEMLGRRFLWQDRKNDETLSWTSSLLFALVHATSRLAKGQRHVRIHVIDTTKVTTLRGDPVEFFFAPDLLRLLNIQAWHGWRASDQSRLKKSWFTHEWITQNVVKSPAKHSFEADIEELIRTGLYDFASELQTRHKKDMNSLYDRCVFTRGAYHGTSVDTTPVTDAIFDQAKELARCFRTTEMVPQNITCVRLHLIIDFLALEARPERDEGLMTRIRSDYSGKLTPPHL